MQTYFMVGAGGTGSHILPTLLPYLKAYHANKGDEYQVVIADGDLFETKNLARQIFQENLTGVNKAEAMVEMYKGHPIIAIPRFIGKDDIEKMIQDGDIVLICADNFSVRHTIAMHVKDLPNVVVINGGNERDDGSVQLHVREGGENKTPSILYGHAEIAFIAADDRAAMTCAVAAQLPGGEQTILANNTSAAYMMQALARYHSGAWKTGWTELNFDTVTGEVIRTDMRERRAWDNYPE